MRTLGTYGGHLELSAFAHAVLKPIRIVQPGLVYVVACDDNSAAAHAGRAPRARAPARALASDGAAPSPRRAAARAAPLECVGPLHLAYVPRTHTRYHSWEHYSSLRRLDGPHTGHPCIPEADADADADEDAECLIHRSVPGHSERTVRLLLRRLGDWEAVVEELLRRDAEHDARASSASSSPRSPASSASSVSASPPPATRRRPPRRTRQHLRAPKAPRGRESDSPHTPELKQLTI